MITSRNMPEDTGTSLAQEWFISSSASRIRSDDELCATASPSPQRKLSTASSAIEQAISILLHDGGGDRTPTVAALPSISDRSRAWIHFVSVADCSKTRVGNGCRPRPRRALRTRAPTDLFSPLINGRFLHRISFILGIVLVSGRTLSSSVCSLLIENCSRTMPSCPDPPRVFCPDSRAMKKTSSWHRRVGSSAA